MTGRELLVALQELTDEQLEFELWIEGCDCVGPAHKLTVETDESLMIERA